jgi:putative lipoic acid-binding regulatory protein
MSDEAKTPIIKFPCDFTIKAMGKANDAFETAVLDIIKRYFSDYKTQKRPSRDNNYIALSITVHAEKQEQLDAIYQELSNCEGVLMAL